MSFNHFYKNYQFIFGPFIHCCESSILLNQIGNWENKVHLDKFWKLGEKEGCPCLSVCLSPLRLHLYPWLLPRPCPGSVCSILSFKGFIWGGSLASFHLSQRYFNVALPVWVLAFSFWTLNRITYLVGDMYYSITAVWLMPTCTGLDRLLLKYIE